VVGKRFALITVQMVVLRMARGIARLEIIFVRRLRVRIRVKTASALMTHDMIRAIASLSREFPSAVAVTRWSCMDAMHDCLF